MIGDGEPIQAFGRAGSPRSTGRNGFVGTGHDQNRAASTLGRRQRRRRGRERPTDGAASALPANVLDARLHRRRIRTPGGERRSGCQRRGPEPGVVGDGGRDHGIAGRAQLNRGPADRCRVKRLAEYRRHGGRDTDTSRARCRRRARHLRRHHISVERHEHDVDPVIVRTKRLVREHTGRAGAKDAVASRRGVRGCVQRPVVHPVRERRLVDGVEPRIGVIRRDVRRVRGDGDGGRERRLLPPRRRFVGERDRAKQRPAGRPEIPDVRARVLRVLVEPQARDRSHPGRLGT